ncbi:MAG: hypothetical protein HC837_19925 [Chloroflexaceae bacterium]|nr:hypothetical protein [Chloroflexaceae bacterium]
MERLLLSSNNLSGSIPPELGNLTNLRELDLSYSDLSGSIPPELGNLTNLWMLDLSHNYLSGDIPRELMNIKIGFPSSFDLNRNCLNTNVDEQFEEFLDARANWRFQRRESACLSIDPGPTPTPSPTPEPAGDPEIVEVDPKYRLDDNTRYLAGIPASNPIEVKVNWNNAEPGNVTFQLNEQSSEVSASGETVSHTYDMGSDLQDGINTITITAYNAEGQASEPVVRQVYAIPQPVWMVGLIQGGLLALPVLTPDEVKGNASVQTGFELPVSPFNIVANPFGPTDAGVKTQFKLQGDLIIPLTCADGSEAKLVGEVKGDGFSFMGASIAIQGYGSIKEPVTDMCVLGDFQGQVGGKAIVEGNIYNKPVFVMISYFNPVVGRTVDTIVGVLRIEEAVRFLGEFYLDGKGSVDLNLTATFVDDATVDYFQTEDLKLEGDLGIQGGYRNGLSFASFDVYMGGGTKMATTINGFFTPDNDWTFDTITLLGEAGVKIRVLWTTREAKGQVSWTYPPTLQQLLTAREDLEDSGWQWADYSGDTNALAISPGANHILASTSFDTASTGIAQVSGGTLINGVYQYPETTMAVYQPTSTALMLWVQPDTAKPAGQAHEIFYSFWDGANWSTPARVTNDRLLDDAPEIAWVDANTAVAVWHRLGEPAPDDATWSDDIGANLEIATATYDVATDSWSPITLLTSNDAIDMVPRISKQQQGELWAVWRRNADGKLLGDAASPDDIIVATYEDGWSTPEIALAGLPGVFDVAVGSGEDETTIAFTQVVSGTSEDLAHIFTSTWDGNTWSAPEQVTTVSRRYVKMVKSLMG